MFIHLSFSGTVELSYKRALQVFIFRDPLTIPPNRRIINIYAIYQPK